MRRTLVFFALGLALATSLGAQSPNATVWTGVFQEGAPRNSALNTGLAAQLGAPFAVQMWFKDFSEPFPAEEAEAAVRAGSLPDITWEPWLWADQQKIHLADILNGDWDAYITAWGKGAAAFGKPVMVRWGHEFNGNWYPWGVANSGENPKTYIKAFRKVHNLVQAAGATNVIWVWCPNNGSVPGAAWNAPGQAYPGDLYVDWVAFDGYDFGGSASFADLFQKVYAEVVAVSDRPIFIGEFATARTGQAKADWLAQMADDLPTKLPAIQGLVWFSTLKEKDWRLDDSPEALKGAATVLSRPLFAHRPADVARLSQSYAPNLSVYRQAALDLLKVVHHQIEVPRVGQGEARFSGPAGVGVVSLSWNEDGLHLKYLSAPGQTRHGDKAQDLLWDADGVEFTVSTDPKANPERATFTSTDWQIGLSPGTEAQPEPRSWEWAHRKAPVPGVKLTSQKTDQGWVLEALVPWAALGGFVPQAGQVLGFDLAVDQAGPDGHRAHQWVWNGSPEFYNNPVQWGAIRLLP